MEPQMNADERSNNPLQIGNRSGMDLDIWGDLILTNSTPIPQEWLHHGDREDIER